MLATSDSLSVLAQVENGFNNSVAPTLVEVMMNLLRENLS